MRLGKKQLARLASMAHVGMAQVVPDAVTKSLVARGLMQPTGTKPGTDDAFIVITADGFRAIADAIETGTIAGRPDFDRMRGGDQ